MLNDPGLKSVIAEAIAPLSRQIDQLMDQVESLGPTASPNLLSVAQAAKMTGLSTKTLYRMLDTRQIPYVQSAPRAAKRIRQAALEAWIKTNTVRAIR